MTAPSIQSVSLNFAMTVTELLANIPDLSPGAGQLVHDLFNRRFSLTPSSSPPVSIYVASGTALGGATLDIDLTAAPGSQGAIDCTGKGLVCLLAVNTNAHQFTVAPGAANAYPLPETLLLHAGGGRAERFFPTPLTAVDGTHKMIRITGTLGDTPILLACFG